MEKPHCCRPSVCGRQGDFHLIRKFLDLVDGRRNRCGDRNGRLERALSWPDHAAVLAVRGDAGCAEVVGADFRADAGGERTPLDHHTHDRRAGERNRSVAVPHRLSDITEVEEGEELHKSPSAIGRRVERAPRSSLRSPFEDRPAVARSPARHYRSHFSTQVACGRRAIEAVERTHPALILAASKPKSQPVSHRRTTSPPTRNPPSTQPHPPPPESASPENSAFPC